MPELQDTGSESPSPSAANGTAPSAEGGARIALPAQVDLPALDAPAPEHPAIGRSAAGAYGGRGGAFSSSRHNAWLSVGFKAFILPRLALHYEYTAARGLFGGKGSLTVGTYLGLTGFGAISADVRAALYMQWWRRSAMYFSLQGGAMVFFSAPIMALTKGTGLAIPEFDYAIGWRWQLGERWHLNLETSPGYPLFTSLPFVSLGVGMKF